jgi:hypothetical protein
LSQSYDGKVNRPIQDILPSTKFYQNHQDAPKPASRRMLR